MSYLAPSEFVTKMVDAGESKIFMSTRDTIIRAYMAGAILALAAWFAVTITVNTGQPLVGALLFPVGFCMLYLLGFDLLTGVFVSTGWGGDVNGSFGQFITQLVAVAIAIVFSGVGSFIIARVVALFIPLRAEEKAEAQGLDIPLHGEEAYGDGEGALLIPVSSSHKAARVANGTSARSRA